LSFYKDIPEDQLKAMQAVGIELEVKKHLALQIISHNVDLDLDSIQTKAPILDK